MAKISASLLAADFSCLKKDLEKLKHVDMLHIDVMDGKFVPNLAMGPDFAKSIRKLTKKKFDVHLMVINPEKYFKSFSMADSITFHIETKNVESNIRMLKNMKKKVGLAINPETDIKKILPCLKKADKVLVMSVHPGFAGQKFIVYSLEKIKKIKEYIKKNKLKTKIEVDGGIGPSNYKKVIKAGADILAMGAALFKNKSLNKFVEDVESFRS
jgi:ribulose-phosphate 3-epimerase